VRHAYGPAAGYWALPGGYTMPGERLDESAVRELEEETGLRTAVVAIIGLVTQYTARGGAVYAVLRMRLLPGRENARPDGVEVKEGGRIRDLPLLRNRFA
jgi:ADP-ribose pyrophosphatase YjhB (NUDIX family)